MPWEQKLRTLFTGRSSLAEDPHRVRGLIEHKRWSVNGASLLDVMGCARLLSHPTVIKTLGILFVYTDPRYSYPLLQVNIVFYWLELFSMQFVLWLACNMGCFLKFRMRLQI